MRSTLTHTHYTSGNLHRMRGMQNNTLRHTEVQTHAHIHTHKHTDTHTHTHTHTHTRTHAHTHKHTHAHTRTHAHTFRHTFNVPAPPDKVLERDCALLPDGHINAVFCCHTQQINHLAGCCIMLWVGKEKNSGWERRLSSCRLEKRGAGYTLTACKVDSAALLWAWSICPQAARQAHRDAKSIRPPIKFINEGKYIITKYNITPGLGA